MILLIKTDITIIAIVPNITGNNMNSKETSVNKTTNGFDAAGGCITFKNTIKVTATPTDKPSEKNENPIVSLKIIPTKTDIKCPKKIFFGCAVSKLWRAKTKKPGAPNENISHTPVDVLKVKKARTLITTDADIPDIIGSIFFGIFIINFQLTF